MSIATRTKPQTLTPAYFAVKLREIARNAAALYERAARGEPMTARDVAMAAEYNQQYVDLLDQMEDAPVVFSGAGRVSFE